MEYSVLQIAGRDEPFRSAKVRVQAAYQAPSRAIARDLAAGTVDKQVDNLVFAQIALGKSLIVLPQPLDGMPRRE